MNSPLCSDWQNWFPHQWHSEHTADRRLWEKSDPRSFHPGLLHSVLTGNLTSHLRFLTKPFTFPAAITTDTVSTLFQFLSNKNLKTSKLHLLFQPGWVCAFCLVMLSEPWWPTYIHKTTFVTGNYHFRPHYTTCFHFFFLMLKVTFLQHYIICFRLVLNPLKQVLDHYWYWSRCFSPLLALCASSCWGHCQYPLS